MSMKDGLKWKWIQPQKWWSCRLLIMLKYVTDWFIKKRLRNYIGSMLYVLDVVLIFESIVMLIVYLKYISDMPEAVTCYYD
jgi:hypothetical protein